MLDRHKSKGAIGRQAESRMAEELPALAWHVGQRPEVANAPSVTALGVGKASVGVFGGGVEGGAGEGSGLS